MLKSCPSGHTFEKISDCPTCPICISKEMNEKYGREFPRIGNPALSALDSIGIKHLTDLTKYSEKELLKLHGFGPKALGILKDTLKERGVTFKANE